MHDLAQPMAKMVDHLGQREPARRAFRGFLIIMNRLVGYPRLGKMPSDQLWFRGCSGRVLLQLFGKTVVNCATPVAQQRGIGGVLHQRVPEDIIGKRRLAVRNNDFGLRELGERGLKTRGWQIRHSLHHFE